MTESSEFKGYEPPLSLPSQQATRTVIAALHGAWHRPQCFDFFREELDGESYTVISPGMPIEDQELNYSAYSDLLANYLETYDDIWILAHSRAGNIAPGLAQRMGNKVLGIIYLCGGVPPTFEDIAIGGQLPEKHDNPAYEAGIEESEDGLTTTYNEKIACDVFFYDCSQSVQDLATSFLRPQRARLPDTVIGMRPRVPETVLFGKFDLATNPQYCEATSLQYLNKMAIPLDTGHTPFLSHPKLLADAVIDIIKAETI